MLERVAVVSIAPILPGAVHGGSQRILEGVLHGLANAGADVRVVCSWRPENDGGFDLAPKISIEPSLQLSGYFPDPWEVAPHKILQSAMAIAPVFDWADSVYLHADTFYLRGIIPEDLRVVRSFHDFHYETALISAFGFNADQTIVPSEYLKRCIEATAGAVPGGSPGQVTVVPNGIDLDLYRPESAVIPRGVRERGPNDLILLWPHRPDTQKGIIEAIQIAGTLKRKLADRNVRLLVPQHVDASSSNETRSFYSNAVNKAAEAGVMESLEFAPWWEGEETPYAYNFADVTLCPGNFIESFSLVAYESLACGTPVVASTVGALRELPDHPDVHLFPWGDIKAASKAVEKASSGMTDVNGIRSLLADQYSFEAMQLGYVEAITNNTTQTTQISEHLEQTYSLAPWCAVSEDRVYHDYEFGWSTRPELAAYLSTLQSTGSSFVLSDANQSGVPSDQIEAAMRDGIIVQNK